MYAHTTTGPATNLELRRLIVERQAAPDILLSGLVTPDDAAALFQMYAVHIAPRGATVILTRLPGITATISG